MRRGTADTEAGAAGPGTPPWSQPRGGPSGRTGAGRVRGRGGHRNSAARGLAVPLPAPRRAAPRRPVVDPGADPPQPAALRQRPRLRPRRRWHRPARHRLGERRGLGRATGGPRLARRRGRGRPRRPRHPPALRPPRPGRARPRGVRRLGRDAPGRRRRGRPPRPRPVAAAMVASEIDFLVGLGAGRDEAAGDVGPAEHLERPSRAWPCRTGRSRTATSPTSRAGGCAPSTRRYTAGHLCFTEEDTRLFFSGDHVLPRITPNISTNHGGLADPLRDYLDALAAVRDLDPAEVLPAHEWRFRGLDARVDELTAHHEHRLTELLAAIRAHPGSTPWELAAHLTWSRPWDAVRAADADLRRHRDRRPPAAAGQPGPRRRQRRPGADVDPGRSAEPAASSPTSPRGCSREPAAAGRASGWSASTAPPARARPPSPDGSRTPSATPRPWCTSTTSTPAGRSPGRRRGCRPGSCGRWPRAGPGAHHRYDWAAGRFAAEPIVVPVRARAPRRGLRQQPAGAGPVDVAARLGRGTRGPAAAPRAGPRRVGPRPRLAPLAGHGGRRVRRARAPAARADVRLDGAAPVGRRRASFRSA